MSRNRIVRSTINNCRTTVTGIIFFLLSSTLFCGFFFVIVGVFFSLSLLAYSFSFSSFCFCFFSLVYFALNNWLLSFHFRHVILNTFCGLIDLLVTPIFRFQKNVHNFPTIFLFSFNRSCWKEYWRLLIGLRLHSTNLKSLLLNTNYWDIRLWVCLSPKINIKIWSCAGMEAFRWHQVILVLSFGFRRTSKWCLRGVRCWQIHFS